MNSKQAKFYNFCWKEAKNKLTYHHLKTRRCVQVKPLLIYTVIQCIIIVLNDVTRKSREHFHGLDGTTPSTKE